MLAGTGWNPWEQPFQRGARGLASQELLDFVARRNPHEHNSIYNKKRLCE
jgi:hypothetical protein